MLEYLPSMHWNSVFSHSIDVEAWEREIMRAVRNMSQLKTCQCQSLNQSLKEIPLPNSFLVNTSKERGEKVIPQCKNLTGVTSAK